MERSPKENRFEFVVIAGARARQLLRGALPRESGEKKITIAQREVLRHKVEKLDRGVGPRRSASVPRLLRDCWHWALSIVN